MRILHILDHSLPLHSGYTFRTLSILREQRRLGWETSHLTGPKQDSAERLEETVDGWHFFRTPQDGTRLARLAGDGGAEDDERAHAPSASGRRSRSDRTCCTRTRRR